MSNAKELLILKIVCAITLFVAFLEGVGLVLLWKHSELEIELIRKDVNSLKITISDISKKSHCKLSFNIRTIYSCLLRSII